MYNCVCITFCVNVIMKFYAASICLFALKLSSDANFVWRLAKATYFKSQIIGTRDKEEQKKLVYDSKDLANDALQIDERNSNAHKW